MRIWIRLFLVDLTTMSAARIIQYSVKWKDDQKVINWEEELTSITGLDGWIDRQIERLIH